MLQVAIVGMGNIGNTHAREYVKRDDCKIVAVCDIIPEKADKAAKDYDAQAFYSIEGMLASEVKIDAASMATKGEENGGDHYTPTMELLRGGLPVLGEKPISNSIPEAREMVALAKEKGLRYGIDLNHRFTPAAALAKQWVDDGKLGELNMINMTMWINNPSDSSPWFHIRALHPHSIDVMRYFCGDVKRVCAFFKRGPSDKQPDGRRVCWSNMQVNMQFESGVVGNLRGSYDATGPGGNYGLETLEVVGTDARFILEEACERLTFSPRRSRENVTYDHLGGMLAFGDTFGSRIGRWVEQSVADAAPEDIEGSGEEALKAQMVIEAAVESWQTGTVVEVG
ncbi:MAG: Gfo/Idh/MocA family oxidoreductase [Lentisphaerae bacterium]|jgi:predicted dehydrogenase|nr:Gfo/Idh/MocA family oxidoreductase [Lentisphaerota bacterium]MBT4814435.1 Gfo/Idh/MocA family oxidoreductase [Lentisphaerota bacterium]MBT5611050.1 Gfo/Idh/MocA family oxidoreductase [Lentisphaerota bacterium]MBT7053885.1 Gfo/Idh/MocA family oxidoreductase [Lentisphaerota bacterium]MBT7840506.1 Gfo/Idh/MocA family oxidoreductase [Lentisphaerota bacterium]